MLSILSSDPHRPVGWRFYVEVDGINVGEFTNCEGLGATRDTEAVEEGGFNLAIHALPGKVTSGDITLKRGVIDLDVWEWFAAEKGVPDPRNVTISLAKSDGTVFHRWEIENTYPTKWKLSNLNAANSEIAIESVVLTRSGRGKGGGGGGGGAGARDEKLDIDNMTTVQLDTLARLLADMLERDLYLERERLGSFRG